MSEDEQLSEIYQYLITVLVERTNMLNMSDEIKLEIINVTLDTLLYTLQPKYSNLFLQQINNAPKEIQIQNEIREAYDIIQSSMKGKG